MATKYKQSLEGEEFVPFEDTHGHGDEVGLKGETYPQHIHGHVSKIEKSEHDGHHKITVDHKHLVNTDEDESKEREGHGFGVEVAPQSVVHMPTGHGFHVGHKVHIRMSHAGQEDGTEG